MNITWISKIEGNMPHKTSRLKMSEALIKRGHNVTLYMVKKFQEKNFSSNYIKCIPTIHLPILSGLCYGLIVFFYFPILLNKKNIDIIIIDCTKIWLPFVLPLKILNIPIILDIRTLPIDKKKSYLFKISIYFSRYIAKGITTITVELSTALRNIYNIKNMMVGIWSSGVDIEDFNNINNKSGFNSKQIKRKFTLIYHGDYSPTRGIENLIKALGKLKSPSQIGISLLIIGMPLNKISSLSNLCKKVGVEEEVTILPKMEYNKIVQILKIADVGVISLPPEYIWWRVSAPLKTLEYLAAGKPIIATDIPFHQKIFKKGNCGILLEDASPETIAKGIMYMYENQNNLKKMGDDGRKIVEKYYTWNNMAQKFEDFLINFVNGSKNV